MSYICEKCGKQIKKEVPQFKITKERLIPTKGGKFRREIESEKKVCPNCGRLKVTETKSNGEKKDE